MARSKKRRLWLDYLVYLAVRSVVAFAQMLSIEQSYALAGFLAWVIYKVDKRHRQVGIDNLARAFGDQYSPAERDQIVRGVYRHFCMMLMEILHTPRRLRLENWRASVELVNLAPLMDHLMSGDRPLIVLTGHYGNWELAGFLFGMFGFPTVSVARTLDNPYLERYLRDFRERTGQSLVPKTGGFDQMVDVLENNRALDLPRRPGCRPARAFCRLLRSAGLDSQGDRAFGDRAQGPRRRRSRQAHRAGLPLRDPLRRRHRPERARRHGRRRPRSHPAVHKRPRTTDPPGSNPVSLAPSALEASAQSIESGEPLAAFHSNIRSTGTIRTDTSLSGKAAICLSSAKTSSGVPCVS